MSGNTIDEDLITNDTRMGVAVSVVNAPTSGASIYAATAKFDWTTSRVWGMAGVAFRIDPQALSMTGMS